MDQNLLRGKSDKARQVASNGAIVSWATCGMDSRKAILQHAGIADEITRACELVSDALIYKRDVVPLRILKQLAQVVIVEVAVAPSAVVRAMQRDREGWAAV